MEGMPAAAIAEGFDEEEHEWPFIPPDREDWIRRLQAVGRAQARYLWTLLVVGVFFWALHMNVVDNPSASLEPLTVPLLNIELSAQAVWATGGPVISFILLAVMGSLRAFGRAASRLGMTSPEAPTGSLEALDLAPNAIDLAVYTTEKTPKFLTSILFFAYPAVLLVFLAEAAWISVSVWSFEGSISAKYVLLPIGTVLWGAALWHVVVMIIRRVCRIRSGKPVQKEADAGPERKGRREVECPLCQGVFQPR